MKLVVTYLLVLVSAAYMSQPLARARLLSSRGEFPASIILLDSCIGKDHFTDSALYFKGLANLKLNKQKEARENCNKLLRSYPLFLDAHFLNGLICFSDSNYGRCIDEFNIVLKQEPLHYKALYNRSVTFGMLGEYLLAVEDLTRCISINKKDSYAFFSRAYWNERMEKLHEAGNDYAETIRLDPGNYDAYFGLAFIQQRNNESEKACETINNAINAGSQIAYELKSNFCR